jgi:DNA repair protein RecN (Recombination protein N)
VILTLRIERMAIVDSADIEFGPGLNVITGETGAGKSIVLGALGLLAGARASAESLRSDAADGLVEAIFRTDCHPELEAELAQHGLEAEPGEDAARELVITRTLSRKGRARTRVAGQTVPVAMLDELFGGRIEISSQRGSQALLDPASQGFMLDAFGDSLALRQELAAQVAEIGALAADLAEIRGTLEENARQQDFLRFQLSEIDAAELEPGQLESLTAEQARLAHAERLREEGATAAGALLGDPSQMEAASAADGIAVARRLLDGLEQLDPALEDVAERLRNCEAELRELGSEVERYVDGIEADPGRLAHVEERLGQLDQLRRKYGDSVEEILAFRDEVAAQLESIEGADARTGALENEIAKAGKRLSKLASQLSEARSKAASKLGRKVQKALRELELPQARFQTKLDPLAPPEGLACGPSGAESVEFLFSANKGERLLPLRKVASGGELSRIFLAVKGALRRVDDGMVLVFDEVDAGMGGRVAERIGRNLAELAERHQVLCITHLPQVAAFAHVHFRVAKAEQGGRTVSRIERLAGDERVEEIARMAGGESVSEATRGHARDLLRASTPG